MATADLIDPTLAGRYPVILGDGLLDRTSDGIFTGIRYNHKPTLSSDDAPNNARLKPSRPGKSDSYDLSFIDDDNSYAYSGSRNTDSSQYILHFDPARKAFILDKIDSTFHMNITKLPGISDPERLRSQYPHLDSQPAPRRATAKKTTSTAKETAAKSATATKARSSSQAQAKEPKRKTAEKKQQQQQQQAKQVALSFPEPQKENPPKPKTQAQSFEDEDEDDEDDDDGGLLIEYPGGDTAKKADFSPAFPPPRRFDDFMDQRDSEADDADGESDDEPDMDFKPLSPVSNHHPVSNSVESNDAERVDDDDGDDDVDDDAENMEDEQEDGMNDMEDDLEKDMEMAFEDMASAPGGDESEISEED